MALVSSPRFHHGGNLLEKYCLSSNPTDQREVHNEATPIFYSSNLVPLYGTHRDLYVDHPNRLGSFEIDWISLPLPPHFVHIRHVSAPMSASRCSRFLPMKLWASHERQLLTYYPNLQTIVLNFEDCYCDVPVQVNLVRCKDDKVQPEAHDLRFPEFMKGRRVTRFCKNVLSPFEHTDCRPKLFEVKSVVWEEQQETDEDGPNLLEQHTIDFASGEHTVTFIEELPTRKEAK